MITKLTFFIALIAVMPFALFSKNSNDTIPKNYGSWEKFSFEAGAFITNSNSNLRFGSEEYGVGVDINLEQALGLKVNLFTGRAQLLYRFTPNLRHSVRAGYYQLSRKATKDLESEFEIGNITFQAGTVIESKLNLSIFKFDYDYSLFMDDRINLSASVGMFIMPTTFSIKAEGSSAEETDVMAPLPVVGFRTNFKITPKFSMLHTIDVFYMKFDGLAGNMLDMSVNLEYKAFEHVAFGLGYNGFDFNFSVNTGAGIFGDAVGEVGYNYAGLMLFGKVMF